MVTVRVTSWPPCRLPVLGVTVNQLRLSKISQLIGMVALALIILKVTISKKHFKAYYHFIKTFFKFKISR